MDNADPEYSFRILSRDPLITLSGCRINIIFIAKLAEDLPKLFDVEKGLHILLPTWNLEGQRAAEIKAAIEHASNSMPGHKFLVISSTEYETYRLGLEAVPSLQTHQAVFLDEQTWKPSNKTAKDSERFDAVYNARLDKEKRHELARRIDNLLLIYGFSIFEDLQGATERIRRILPHAYFANAERGDGTYVPLNAKDIANLYSNARVGLCLSQEEGYSRVSIEYMMCGLPVVSTRSIGGRDRYYENEYCRVVDDDEKAIARAVRQLAEKNYPPHDIRNALLHHLAFERCNFLRAINRIVEDFSGRVSHFSSLKSFLGIKQEFPRHSRHVCEARAGLAHTEEGRSSMIKLAK